MKKLFLLPILFCAVAAAQSTHFIPQMLRPMPVSGPFGGCLTGTYTTYNETWNLSGGDPAWSGGPSTACQTWLPTTGSNQEIVSAPGAGWNNANVLELPSGSTSATLESVGTIPYVPSGSNTTITMEFEYSSTTVTGYRTILSIQYPGAGSSDAFSLNYAGSGSGSFYVNGSDEVGISAGTRHLLSIVLNGASSSFSVDGTQEATFTAPTEPFNEIILIGDTGSGNANLYWGQIGISNSSYPGWAGRQLWDAYGGTSGSTVTQTTLNGAQVCNLGGSGILGWTYTAGSSTDSMEFSNAATISFPSALSICSGSYSGNVGLSLDHHVLAGSTPEALAYYDFTTTYASSTVGFYFYTHAAGSYPYDDAFGTGNWILQTCYSTSTSSCAGVGSNFQACIEQSNPYEDIGCVAIADSTWYWVTGTINVSGEDTVNFYSVNQSTGAIESLLGSVSATDISYSPGGTQSIDCGAVGSEAPGVALDSYCSNVILETAHPVFPLLPEAGSY